MLKLLAPVKGLFSRLISLILGNPALVRSGTKLLSRFPRTFNWLIQFARQQGLLTGTGNQGAPEERIHTPDDLHPEARGIYEELYAAIESEYSRKPR